MTKKQIKITQIKSRIGYSKKAKATLDALGLRKMNKSVILDLNDAINGMIKKIYSKVSVVGHGHEILRDFSISK